MNTKTRQLRKNIKAISPVLAVLMMIAVAIAGSLITYAWVTGYIGFTTEKAGKAIMVQSVANSGDDLLVYVQNVGEGTVELDPDSCVYRNGELFPCDIVINGEAVAEGEKGLLPEGDTAELTLTDGAAAAGEKVTIKVTTLLGTFTEKSTYPASTTGGGGGPTPPAWLYRKQITIQHSQVAGTGAHTNFPVLISLPNDPQLATYAQDNGNDIKFVLDGETNKLNHEIETFNGDTGQLVAWVRIPSLSATADTILYMYYGNSEATNQQNPTGVWDTNYKGVWHLSETGTGTADEYKDSTINNNNGQGGGGTANRVPARVTGRIGYAQDFEGTDSTPDFINVGSGSSLDITGSITLEAWVRVESWDYEYWHMIIARQFGTGSGDGYLLCLNDGGTAYIIVGSNNANRGGVTTGTWYHIVGVASGSTRRVYINAVGGTTGSGVTWSLDSNPIIIGAGENGSPGTYPNEQFDGVIDEVRISNTVRSSDWIQTEYNNMNTPLGTFFTLGGHETL